MTKYLSREPFSVSGAGSKQYRDNYDRVFGKPAKDEAARSEALKLDAEQYPDGNGGVDWDAKRRSVNQAVADYVMSPYSLDATEGSPAAAWVHREISRHPLVCDLIKRVNTLERALKGSKPHARRK